MPLVLLCAGLAWADRIYWVEPPTPADRDAAQARVPGAAEAPLDALMAAPADDGGAAIDTLRAELTAVRPLLNEFDGELQIMARLQKATADVTRLRSEAEADLYWSALLFQGNAVHRYFGDKLGLEPASLPYVRNVGPAIVVAAWADAVALRGTAAPPETDIPEKPQRLNYDGIRALIAAMPAASMEIGRLAAGAEVWLDGRRVGEAPGSRTLLVPGRHFVSVRAGDLELLAGDAALGEGATLKAEAPFGPAERDALVALARGSAAGWAVPEAAMVPIRGAQEPVYVAVPARGNPKVWRVDRGAAEAVAAPPRPATASPLSVHVGAGAGWLSTGDFFLQNIDAGAPYTEATVNAATPALAADVQLRSGWFAASAGAALMIATGEHHTLPSGDADVGTFVYPHLGVGLPWVQATVGPLFPWYLGVGAKGRVPVTGDLEVVANVVYGAGVVQPRSADAPDFEPLPLYAAWGGVGWKFD